MWNNRIYGNITRLRKAGHKRPTFLLEYEKMQLPQYGAVKYIWEWGADLGVICIAGISRLRPGAVWWIVLSLVMAELPIRMVMGALVVTLVVDGLEETILIL